jgi:hypothetical protein
MTTVAATIGLRGRRPALSLDYYATHGRRRPRRAVTSTRTARTLERLMLAVVRGGTGSTPRSPA